MPADVTGSSTEGPTAFDHPRTQQLYQALAATLPGGARTIDVAIGLHWTAVVVERGGRLQCGLASTVAAPHVHGESADVEQAGHLVELAPDELTEMVYSSSPTERAVGLATINASLERHPDAWRELGAAEVIVREGKGKRVGVIGHFPFIARIRNDVGDLMVFELNPSPGELPPAAAPEVLPTCSVVAITGTTLINGTFGGLMDNVAPDAFTMLLGPSAPMSPVIFAHGIDLVAGTEVLRIQPVLQAIREGATYRQIHKFGTRHVTLAAHSESH